MISDAHKGHRERIRQRYAENGIEGFLDHEVLELILYYSIPYRDTNVLAHELIRKYGSLSGVFEADPADLTTVKGVGPNTSSLLSLIPSLCRRYFSDKWGKRPILASSSIAGSFARDLLTGRIYEVFYTFCLDSGKRLNHAALIQEGTLNEAAFYPRLIVEAAIRHKAVSIILAHNHPGGNPNPSDADIEVTRRIKGALLPFSIEVADHIIVAGGIFTSLVERGFL